MTARRGRSGRTQWLLAWPGGALIGMGNGVLREATYGKRVSEYAAHQLSGATAALAFALYFAALQRRWLTVTFEFGFGRLVAKQSWRALLSDYNLADGRTWPLVLGWIGAGPAVVSARDRRP